ncbi:uncharacterized protein EDB91DRAFT_1040623, partial [Suillus paluster]|uniref:uncharacterized protein n=1 Tax=Suillus paluster TaxID=48578 RepID=UPI001B85F814
FVNSADELFGPMTTIRRTGQAVKRIPWTAFSFKTTDWERINDAHAIISDANNIQHYFAHDRQPTLWRAIPALEELQTTWEAKSEAPRFSLYKDAIQRGLAKISKYYCRFDDKLVYVLALVLHPYYKLVYIKMAWGGPDEQKTEHEAGNLNAKDWHNKALQIVEKTMEEYW